MAGVTKARLIQLIGSLAIKHPQVFIWTSYDVLDKNALAPFIQRIQLTILAIDSKSESDLKKGLLLALKTAEKILENLGAMDTKGLTDYQRGNAPFPVMAGVSIPDLMTQFKGLTQSIFNQALDKFKVQSERDIAVLPEGSEARIKAQALYEKSLKDLEKGIAAALVENTKPWYQNLTEAVAKPELQGLLPYVAAVVADQSDVMEMLALTTNCFQNLIKQPILQDLITALHEAEMVTEAKRLAAGREPEAASRSFIQHIPGFRPDTPEKKFEKEEAARRKEIFGSVLDALKSLIGRDLHGVVDSLKGALTDDEIKTYLPMLHGYIAQLKTLTFEIGGVHELMQLLATPKRIQAQEQVTTEFDSLLKYLSKKFDPEKGTDSGYASREASSTSLTELADEAEEVFFDARGDMPEEAMEDCLSHLSALCREVGLQSTAETTPMPYASHQAAFVQRFFTPGLKILSQYWAEIEKQKQDLDKALTDAEKKSIQASIISLESKVKSLAGYLTQAAQLPVLTLLGENPSLIITRLLQGDYVQNLDAILKAMPGGVSGLLDTMGVSTEVLEMIKSLLRPAVSNPGSDESPPSTPITPTTPEPVEDNPAGAQQKKNRLTVRGLLKKISQVPGNIKRNFQYLRSTWPFVKEYLLALSSAEKNSSIFKAEVLDPLKTELLEKRKQVSLLSPDDRSPFQSVSQAMISALIGVVSVLKDLRVTDAVSLAKNQNPIEALLNKTVMLDEKGVSLKTLLTTFLDTLAVWLPEMLQKMPLDSALKQELAEGLSAILRDRQADPLKCLMALMVLPPADSPLGKALAEKGYFALLSPILADIFADKEGAALLSAVQGVFDIVKVFKPTETSTPAGPVVFSWELFSPTVSKVVHNLQTNKHDYEKQWIQFLGRAANLGSAMAESMGNVLQIFQPVQPALSQEDAWKQLTEQVQGYQQKISELEEKYASNLQANSALEILMEISGGLEQFMFALTLHQAIPQEIQFATQVLGPLLKLLTEFTKQFATITAGGSENEETRVASQQLFGYLEMVAMGVKTALDNPIFVKASENFLQLVQEGLKTTPDTQKILALLPAGLKRLLAPLIHGPLLDEIISSMILVPPQGAADPTVVRMAATPEPPAQNPAAPAPITSARSLSADGEQHRQSAEQPAHNPDGSRGRNSLHS